MVCGGLLGVMGELSIGLMGGLMTIPLSASGRSVLLQTYPLIYHITGANTFKMALVFSGNPTNYKARRVPLYIGCKNDFTDLSHKAKHFLIFPKKP